MICCCFFKTSLLAMGRRDYRGTSVKEGRPFRKLFHYSRTKMLMALMRAVAVEVEVVKRDWIKDKSLR